MRTDRAEALLLVCAVHHLAAVDAAIFVDRDDQRAAEPAEQRADVRLLLFRMIFFGEHQLHSRLATERLAPMRRHMGELRLFAVALENAGDRRLHVGRRSAFSGGRSRQRLAGLHERASSNRTSKLVGNMPCTSSATAALPVTRPSCCLSSPVAVPLRRPIEVPPAAALQCLISPVFLNTSRRNGRLNSRIAAFLFRFSRLLRVARSKRAGRSGQRRSHPRRRSSSRKRAHASACKSFCRGSAFPRLCFGVSCARTSVAGTDAAYGQKEPMNFSS